MKPIFSILVALALCLPSLADAQRKNRKKAEPKPAEVSLDAFSFRNVDQHFYLDVFRYCCSPQQRKCLVCCSRIWRCLENRKRWNYLVSNFDDQSTYTTGCVAIDPPIQRSFG